MARVALEHTIQLAQTIMATRIDEIGDVQLPAQSDPFQLQSAEGAFVNMYSNKVAHRHLKYSIMLAAAQGLWDVLINQHNFHEANFGIYEFGVGRVGGGIIGAAG